MFTPKTGSHRVILHKRSYSAKVLTLHYIHKGLHFPRDHTIYSKTLRIGSNSAQGHNLHMVILCTELLYNILKMTLLKEGCYYLFRVILCIE